MILRHNRDSPINGPRSQAVVVLDAYGFPGTDAEGELSQQRWLSWPCSDGYARPSSWRRTIIFPGWPLVKVSMKASGSWSKPSRTVCTAESFPDAMRSAR